MRCPTSRCATTAAHPCSWLPTQGGIFDDEAEAVALDESSHDLGALAEDDAFSGDPSLREEASERGQGRSAEEAAIHIEGDGEPLPDDLP